VRRIERATVLDSARKLPDLVSAPLIQERAARIREHRPWPAPARSWVMAQSWIDLLFAHWSVARDVLEPVVPPQLSLDTFDGRAWISVTPFEVRNLRLRPMLPLPLLSAFPEINVRTYVTFDGKPGIFFFSLDADSAPAVAAARRFYRLPYFRARMSIERVGDEIRYESQRTAPERPAEAAFRGRYRAAGEPSPPVAGTLEHWLTERYCLYTLDDRARVQRGEIHHSRWRLQGAEADIAHNTMAEEVGVELTGEPLLHYAARQDVVFWSLEPASVGGG
jgi:uncharacterized protein YqjF (DUF2071 family)